MAAGVVQSSSFNELSGVNCFFGGWRLPAGEFDLALLKAVGRATAGLQSSVPKGAAPWPTVQISARYFL